MASFKPVVLFLKIISSVDNESYTSINMSKLLLAIQKVKRKGAAASDDIPPTSLGPLALQELLSIFIISFQLADYRQIWRVAIIIPLLIDGKTSSDVASFRIISLTCFIVKLVECIIADRLCYIAESNNLCSRFQAGFYKGRNCEDEILQIFQAIEDGFQQRPIQCSVLTLLNFSKAYDTI